MANRLLKNDGLDAFRGAAVAVPLGALAWAGIVAACVFLIG